MTQGICGPWINESDIAAACPDGVSARRDAAILATAILYRWSGRQFPGICQRTVRPCASQTGCGTGLGHWPNRSWAYPTYDEILYGTTALNTPSVPYLTGGEWRNIPACGGNCYLPTLDSIPGPIVSIDQIVIDGVVLDPSAYRIAGYFSIVRTDGGSWPCSQRYDLSSAPGGDPGTCQFTYQYGRLPGPDGVIACRIFASEIARFLCCGECKLPDGITRLIGEGVDMVLDPEKPVQRQQTGQRLVDAWLNSVNPHKLARRSTVQRLDTPPRMGGLR